MLKIASTAFVCLLLAASCSTSDGSNVADVTQNPDVKGSGDSCGTANPCEALKNPCLQASCVDGECQVIELSFTTCDPGDACALGGTCVLGECQPQGAVECDD